MNTIVILHTYSYQQKENYINYERRDEFEEKVTVTMMIVEPTGKQLTFDLKDDLGTVKFWFVPQGAYKICAKYDIVDPSIQAIARTLDFLFYISSSELIVEPEVEGTSDDIKKLQVLTKFINEIKENLNQITNLQEKSMVSVQQFKDAEVDLANEIRTFTLIESLLVLGAGAWQIISLRMYFKRKNIK